MNDRKDKFCLWLAHKLPRRLVYWCYIRVAAHATCAEYRNLAPDQINLMQALEAWKKP